MGNQILKRWQYDPKDKTQQEQQGKVIAHQNKLIRNLCYGPSYVGYAISTFNINFKKCCRAMTGYINMNLKVVTYNNYFTMG